MKKREPGFDWGVFAACLLLAGCGIVLVYSSSFALAEAKYGTAGFFLSRHAIRAVLAIICFAVFINVDYHVWTRMGHVLFAVALVLLVVVLVSPHSHAIKGARRWISVGFVSFQASEFARIALIVFLARKIGEPGMEMREWKSLARVLLYVAMVAGLVLVEPNFSTAAVVVTVGLAVVFVSGARLSHLAAIAAAVLPLAVLGLVGASYRYRRLLAFLHPDQSRDGIGYQSFQALIGLGNGGIFGRGLGQAEQKFFYLPEPHTDFAFAILGEEIGFVGMVVVLAVFAFIIYRGVRIALAAPDKSGQALAFGMTCALGAYVVLHGLVNTGLAPTTGVPLPFLSYGGMSLIFTMCGMGILLNISTQTSATRPALQDTPAGGPRKSRWKNIGQVVR